MRHRRRAALVPSVLLAVACLVGCGTAAVEQPPVTAQAVAPKSAPGWTRFTDVRHHLQVAFPSSWRRARHSLTPYLADPREVLAIGTAALAVDRHADCAHMPVGALARLGPGDTLVTLMERRRPGPGYPPRPRHFHLGVANQSEAIACLSDRTRLNTWWRPFRDGDRAFYALVAVGRPAPARQRRVAERILDSLRFTAAGKAG